MNSARVTPNTTDMQIGPLSNFLETPVRNEFNTNANVETDLLYDSETLEVSFSNEKSRKYKRRRKAPVILTSRVLKY
jgi:hypothetical protein